MFKKADRSKSKLRLALCGPSGSGKTYGALKIAKGIGGKIAVIDTEEGSASYYSDWCEFDVLNLAPPFHPDKFVKAIEGAVKSGYDIVIVDSGTHEWAGPGGCLEINDEITKSKYRGNSWAAWNETKKLHAKFVSAILHSPIHIIATARSKTERAQEDDGGKKKIVKLGMKTEQQEGFEYDFTIMLDLQHEGNYASVNKDRTGMFKKIFGDNPVRLSEDVGVKLVEYLNSGKDIPDTLEKNIDSNDEQNENHVKEVIGFIDKINETESLESLKTFFSTTYNYCKKKGFNDELMNRLTAAKDLRKENFESKIKEDIPQ